MGMVGLLCGGFSLVSAQTWNPNADDGVEILTRGPVHEAFAGPVNYNPTQGDVVMAEPPEAIEEIPPEEMPEGDNVTWISGYWSWDDERDDFIWISGIWRDPPPDRSWIPGYWATTDGSWTWSPGFWTPTESREVEYLPQPPNSLEYGPSTPAPAANRLWVSGCWIWHKPWLWSSARYAWRPGYWVLAEPEWVWQPAQYIWTRRGYVYVEGYWDRTLDRRGILFAPIYARHSVRTHRAYVYSPSIVIQIGFLTVALFDSPNSHHYYFGDYYGDEYSKRGFRPWFEEDRRHRGYDPIFSHQRWQHKKKNDRWEEDMRKDYDFRRQHVEARPARTYSPRAEEGRGPEREREQLRVAVPLRELSTRREEPIRFKKIDETRRKSLGSKAKELDRFRDERVKWETKIEKTDKVQSPKAPRRDLPELRKPSEKTRPSKPTKEETKQPKRSVERPEPQRREKPPSTRSEPSRPERVKIPQSPVEGMHVDGRDRGENPPERPEAPKADRKIRATPGSRDNAKHESVEKSEAAVSGPKKTPEDKGEKGSRGEKEDDQRSRQSRGSR